MAPRSRASQTAGLPDVVRAADDHHGPAGEEVRGRPPLAAGVVVEDVEAAGRGGGDEAGQPVGHQPGVGGVDGLDVLGRIEDAVQRHLGHLRGQRAEHEDPGHPRVGVELADRGQHVGQLGVLRQPLGHERAPDGLGVAPQPALVGQRGVVVADQDRGQTRPRARLPGHLQLAPDARAEVGGQLPAVDDGGAHGGSDRSGAQDRPTIVPSSSTSMLNAAGFPPRPGMVRISPHSG